MILIDQLSLTEEEKDKTIYAVKLNAYKYLHTLGIINHGLLKKAKEEAREKACKDC